VHSPLKPEEPKELTLFTENYETILNAWNFKRLLSNKYDVVVTNPPYMGGNGMGAKLSDYVKE
jgi:methylase of polypeptide subunit release factors